jgi:enoyl-CoA hydratase/carnithine racemase
MSATKDLVARILRNDRRAVESAKETIMEVIGRPLDDQLRLEALLGYSLCGDNPEIVKRSAEFFDKTDRGRAGKTPTSL